MERLTERDDGWVMRKGCHGPCRTCTGVECADIYPMIDRLVAYEDTGLEPEEIMELAQAEKDGRLVVLPCKVGDEVWWIGTYQDEVKPIKILNFKINYTGIYEVGCTGGDYTPAWFAAKDIGKTVFLTRAEAEAALKGDKS